MANKSNNDNPEDRKRKRGRYKQYLIDDSAKVPRQSISNWKKGRDDHEGDVEHGHEEAAASPSSSSTSGSDFEQNDGDEVGVQSSDFDQMLLSSEDIGYNEDEQEQESTSGSSDQSGSDNEDKQMCASSEDEAEQRMASGDSVDAEGDLGNDDIQTPEQSDNETDDGEHEELEGHPPPEHEPREDRGEPDEDPHEDPLPHDDISEDQAVLMILSYVLRHKLTGEALKDLLILLNDFAPGISPKTKFLFSKCFQGVQDQIEIHYYCKSCLTYVGKENFPDVCPNDACLEGFSASENKKNGNFVIYMPVESQLRDLFSSKEIAQSRIEKKRDVKDFVGDIFDGCIMQDLIADGMVGADDFTLLWNCDGIPVFKSSKFSIWPLQFLVNELPPEERRKHVLFCGLWFGPTKPDMSTFFTPFLHEAEALAGEGFQWSHPESGEQIHSRAFFLTAACDSVARPTMRNCIQFNGCFGCDWCLQPGQVVEKGAGTVRVYPYRDEPETRTQEEWEENVQQATPQNPVNGVKGPSLLLFLPLFNIVCGFVPDYMHCVLLGVVRQVVKLWFDSSFHDKPWYLGNKVPEFDAKLLGVKPPRELRRAPRSITSRAYWKATEWKSFLLYFSPLVLGGLLPVQYLKHWCLLVFSMQVLLQSKVPKAMIDKADVALKKFVLGIENLYGIEHVSFNVHLLTHLAESVQQWGPLWAASAFSFESNNGKLLNFFHGTQYVPQQISESFLLWRSIPKYLGALNDAPNKVRQFVERLWLCTSVLPKHAVKLQGAILFGCAIDMQIPLRIFAAMRNLLGYDIHNRMGKFFQRVMIGRCMFYCKSYNRSVRRLDFCVQLNNGSLGTIEHIIVCKLNCNCLENEHCHCQQSIIVVVSLLVKQVTHVFQDAQIQVNSSDLFYEVQPSFETTCAYARDIKRKCVAMYDRVGNMFVSPLCNMNESD